MAGSPRPGPGRCRVERLEDRTVPATISYAGGTYANHFDWLPASGSYVLSTASPHWFDAAPLDFGSAAGNHTARGWQLHRHAGSSPQPRFLVDAGGSTSGAVYSYGSSGATDRALGQLASMTLANAVGATFTNTGAATYTGFTLSYTVEQWRRGTTAAPGYDVVAFEYATAAGGATTNIATGTFVAAPAGDLRTVNTSAALGATDGNATANRVARAVTVTGIRWAPGENLSVRWKDADTPLNDDGLAVDDLTFSADGGGTGPAGFTAGNVVAARVANGAVTLDEFTPGGAGGVSVPLPDGATGSDTFTLSADPGEGLLTRSADGRSLAVGGHRARPGQPTAGADGLVAVVGADAAVDLSTRFPGAGTVRAVASADGRGYYLAADDGVGYVPFGNPTAAGVAIASATQSGPTATITTAAPHGLAVGQPVTVGGVSAAGYDGTFVVAAVPSAATFTYVLPMVGLPDGAGGTTGGRPHATRLTEGAGPAASVGVAPDGGLVAVADDGPVRIRATLPVAGVHATNPLSGFGPTGDVGQVVFSPDGRTAYVADRRTDGRGGLYRYVLSAGEWSATGSYRFPAAGLFGLAVDFGGTAPAVYATTVEADGSANRLVRFADAGGPIAGPVVLAVAPAGSAYRGVALAPVAAGATPTTTSLAADATGSYGDGVTLTATVNRRGGVGVAPAGWVSFRTGGTEVGAAPLVDGVATFRTAGNLGVFGGPHEVTAVYTGSVADGPSTSAPRTVGITRAGTVTTAFVSPDPVRAGDETTVSAEVTVPAGTRPTGTVTFYDGAFVLGEVRPLAVGVDGGGVRFRAGVTVRFALAGEKGITAAYSGDVNFAGSESPAARLTVQGTVGFASASASALADPGVLRLTLARAGGAAGAVTVEGYTVDGTAAAGADFTGIPQATPFTVTFAEGQSEAELPVSLLLPPAPYGGTRTFTVVLQNPTGGAALGGVAAATVTLSDPPLRVEGEPVVTGGSITIPFNRRVDPTAASLFGATPDFTLLDVATGQPAAVGGSLVAGADGRPVTWVHTAGPLPAGSYRVRLGGGLRGLDGRPLDGDGDGTPGGSYTSGVLTVTAPAVPVVGVRGFAVGPGQPVVVPVAVRGRSNVTAAGFTLTYDPALLTIPPSGALALSPAAAAAGLVLDPYTIASTGDGRSVLTAVARGGSGWTPDAGGILLTVAGTVPADTPYGGLGLLDVGGVDVDGTAGSGADGVHIAAHPGDATADRRYSALDAALLAQLGADGFAAFPRLDPVIAGDVTGDNVVDAGDAERVGRKGGGGTVPELPDLPPVEVAPPAGPDAARLSFEAASAVPGETVTVRLRLAALADFALSALDHAIGFDPAVLTVSNVRGGSLFGQPGAFTTLAPTVDNVNGILRLAQYVSTPGGVPLAAGTDADVLLFDVTVNPAASPGTTTALNLLRSTGGTTTAASDTGGARVLAPTPTDNDDPNVDAVLTVAAPGGNRPPVVAVPPDVPRVLFNPTVAPGLRVAAPSRHSFSAAGGNPITVSAPDAGDNPVTLRLTADGGALTLATTAGLTVTGDGTAAVSLRGPVAAANAALDSLAFTPDAGFHGRAALRVEADDRGATASASASVEVVGLFVSELMLGPAAGTPGPNQYVELASTAPDYVIPAGVVLVGIEGDRGGDAANNPGLVQDVVRLGGLRTGPNGYLALLQRGEGYTAAGATSPLGAVRANAPTGTPTRLNAGYGNGGTSSRYVQDGAAFTGVHLGQGSGSGNRPGTAQGDRMTDLERGSVSYLLIRSDVAPAVGADIDADDIGTPGGPAYDGWTVLDGVAVLDAAGADLAYAPVTFRSTAGGGTALADSAVVATGSWAATYAGRVGPGFGYAAAHWLGAVAVAGKAAGAFALSDTQATAFPGQALRHVGAANVWAPRATVVVNDGSHPQRSQVGHLTVRFGRPVDVAGPGAFTLRGAGPVDLVAVPLDGTANPDGSHDGVTAVSLRFAPGAGTVPFATPDPFGNVNGLADAAYTLTIDATLVTAGGVPLDGDRDGRPGGDLRFAVRRLFGDATGDGKVNLTDERQFRKAYGSSAGRPAYRYYFDADLDGDIDAADRSAFFRDPQ